MSLNSSTLGRCYSVLAFLIATAAAAGAQTPPTAVCELNPYPVGGVVRVHCWTETSTTRVDVPPTVFRFGEGVVHAPGSELAFLVLTNFEAAPQTVTIEFIMQGDARPIWRTFTLQAHQRLPIEVHDDDAFAGLVTFNTRVFWAADGDASLVMRPNVDPFSRATIPPPAVTSGKFYTPPQD